MESSEKVGDEKQAQRLIEVAEIKKCCSICKTTTTPLWRSGPSGPKSLCNACGIRYRKKRPGEVKKGKIGNGRNLKVREGLMMMQLGKEGGGQVRGPRSTRPRQWGEVERAALLLMALSYGAAFASATHHVM